MLRMMVICTVLLAGCAEITAIPVTAENPNPKGFPVYGNKPILIVTGTQANIKFIPNRNERYAVQFRAFLATNDTTLTLNDNGTVGSVDANLDSTAVIPLLEKALEAGGIVPTASGQLDTSGTVRVFDFVFHEDGSLSLREISPTIRVASQVSPTVAAGDKGSLAPVDEK